MTNNDVVVERLAKVEEKLDNLIKNQEKIEEGKKDFDKEKFKNLELQIENFANKLGSEISAFVIQRSQDQLKIMELQKVIDSHSVDIDDMKKINYGDNQKKTLIAFSFTLIITLINTALAGMSIYFTFHH